jgi:hypothetical protein
VSPRSLSPVGNRVRSSPLRHDQGSRIPSRKAVSVPALSLAAGDRMPTRGTLADCCARAASGNDTAAPPRAPRNSRRLMSAPRLGTRHRTGSNECFDRGRNGIAAAIGTLDDVERRRVLMPGGGCPLGP